MHQGSIHACEMAAWQLDGICRGSLMNLPPQFAPEPLFFTSAERGSMQGALVRLAILWDMDAKGGPEASKLRGVWAEAGCSDARRSGIRRTSCTAPPGTEHSSCGIRESNNRPRGSDIAPAAARCSSCWSLGKMSDHSINPTLQVLLRACRWPLGQCSLPRHRACPHAAQEGSGPWPTGTRKNETRPT